jgi:hypothetical protein
VALATRVWHRERISIGASLVDSGHLPVHCLFFVVCQGWTLCNARQRRPKTTTDTKIYVMTRFHTRHPPITRSSPLSHCVAFCSIGRCALKVADQ